MARPKIYQRKFLIKKEFQWKFILLYAVTVSSIVGLTTMVMYWQLDEAIEHSLYSVHIKVEKVGDLLLSLMFYANFTAILAIVLMVTLLSLGVFRSINRHFSALGSIVSDMAQGTFSDAVLPDSRFFGVDRLNQIIDQTRMNYQGSYALLDEALRDLEQGCGKESHPELLKSGQAKLADLLKEVSFEK